MHVLLREGHQRAAILHHFDFQEDRIEFTQVRSIYTCNNLVLLLQINDPNASFVCHGYSLTSFE